MIGSRLIVRNVTASLVTQIVSWMLTFAVTLYLPRYVGAGGLGKLAFAASFVSLFAILVPLGTSAILVREIARDRSRTGELLGAALVLRFCTGLIMTGVAITLVYVLGYPAITRVLVVVMASGMIIGTFNDAIASALQGLENLPRQSVAVVVEKCLSSALSIILVLFRAPLWSLAAVGLFSGTVSLLVNLTAFTHIFVKWQWPNKETLKYIVVSGFPFIGYVLCRTLYGQTDPVILSLITNDRTVGWYAAAFRLVGSTMIVPMALSAALFPTLSRLYRESAEEFQRLARRMLAIVMLCGIPISIAFIGVPDRLIALLHYPRDFDGSIAVLRVDGVAVFMFYVGCALGPVVFATDGHAKMVRASFIACIIGIPACVVGSYITHRMWNNGAVGAALSDVVLEMYLVAAYLQIVPPGTYVVGDIALFGRILLASLPLAALMYLTNRTGSSLWGIAAGIPIYVLACGRLNCLDPQVLKMVRKMVVRRQDVSTETY